MQRATRGCSGPMGSAKLGGTTANNGELLPLGPLWKCSRPREQHDSCRRTALTAPLDCAVAAVGRFLRMTVVSLRAH